MFLCDNYNGVWIMVFDAFVTITIEVGKSDILELAHQQ
jgi:hypothetical protein